VVERDKGIVYLFSGVGFAERLVVSIWSLRRHYAGPILVMATDDDCEGVVRRLAGLDVECLRIDKAAYRRNAAYATKPRLPASSPFERSLFIDGDTIVVGDPSPLFDELAGQVDLVITNFGGWHSQGGRMSKRIKAWRGLSPGIDTLVDLQLTRRWSAINTGVFAWRKGWQYARHWDTITDKGSPRHMADELAMQLCQSMMETASFRVVEDRWNCSPIYGEHKTEAVIWHFHGNKHLRKDVGRAMWIPAFEAARADNVGGLAEWAGQYDRTVRDFLKGQVPV
jgi:hypothetical protein